MPELPEVETMCRGIAAIVGRRVLRVERAPCRRRPIAIQPRIDRFQRRVEGKTVVGIHRAGKRVVIWLEVNPKSSAITHNASGTVLHGEEAIVIEPRMTGLVLLTDPPTQEHLRFRMKLARVSIPGRRVNSKDGGSDLLFWDRRGLGSVQLMSADEYATRFIGSAASLGPDALHLSVDQLRERFCRSRRAIKVALLDQRAIAGVGNLYASEILHMAGVHPAARCHRIRSDTWRRIQAAMRNVLQQAIRYEGSTLADGTYRTALNESGGYQNHHRVYDRETMPCMSCGRGPIRRIVQAQRSTFFCPHCQQR